MTQNSATAVIIKLNPNFKTKNVRVASDVFEALILTFFWLKHPTLKMLKYCAMNCKDTQLSNINVL